MPTRIIIEVQGGVVTRVWADVTLAEVSVLDRDEPDDDEHAARLEAECETLYNVL